MLIDCSMDRRPGKSLYGHDAQATFQATERQDDFAPPSKCIELLGLESCSLYFADGCHSLHAPRPKGV
jgi:hypothetical protein